MVITLFRLIFYNTRYIKVTLVYDKDYETPNLPHNPSSDTSRSRNVCDKNLFLLKVYSS